MSQPKGKIARLPDVLRDELNQKLLDNVPLHHIVRWLEEQGHPGFNEMNLSRWRTGGYQTWLKAQERLDELEFLHDLALQQARADDPAYHDAAVSIAQMQFYEALTRLDGAQLSLLVEENRKEFIQLLKTFTHFNRYCLQRDRFRNDLKQQDKAEEERHRPPKQALTPKTMETICDQLNLR